MFRTTDSLLPNVIRRQQYRAKPYATVVGIDGVHQDVSFYDLETSSNRAAWFLAEKVTDNNVFYMGPNDIRYVIWIIAAIKTGKCVENAKRAMRDPRLTWFLGLVPLSGKPGSSKHTIFRNRRSEDSPLCP